MTALETVMAELKKINDRLTAIEAKLAKIEESADELF